MKKTCVLLLGVSLLGISSANALGCLVGVSRQMDIRQSRNAPVQGTTQQNRDTFAQRAARQSGDASNLFRPYLTGKTWMTSDGIRLHEVNVPVVDNTCGYAAVDQDVSRVLRNSGRSSKEGLINSIVEVIDGAVSYKQYQIKTAIAQEICQGLQNEERLQTSVAWPNDFLGDFIGAQDRIDFCRRTPEALKAYLEFCKRNPRMAEVIIPDGGLLVASAYVQERNLVVVAKSSEGNVRIRSGSSTRTYADGEIIAQYTAIPNAPLLFVYYSGNGDGGHFTRLER